MSFSYQTRKRRLFFLGGRRGGVLDAGEAHAGSRAVPSGGRCFMGLPNAPVVVLPVGQRPVARRPFERFALGPFASTAARPERCWPQPWPALIKRRVLPSVLLAASTAIRGMA